MDKPQNTSGPQFRADRPTEQEAVRTTIVGGRPPGSGQGVGPIPRGIEVLVKKASIDPSFRELLFEKRAEAAAEIGLNLDAAEVMMLRAVPDEQLDAIIKQTSVPRQHRRAFLGTAATTMLAALGVITAGCVESAPKGIRPDRPEDTRPDRFQTPPGGCDPNFPDEPEDTRPDRAEPTDGVRPEPPEPPPDIEDERPDRVEPTEGARPEPPEPPEDPPSIAGARPRCGLTACLDS